MRSVNISMQSRTFVRRAHDASKAETVHYPSGFAAIFMNNKLAIFAIIKLDLRSAAMTFINLKSRSRFICKASVFPVYDRATGNAVDGSKGRGVIMDRKEELLPPRFNVIKLILTSAVIRHKYR